MAWTIIALTSRHAHSAQHPHLAPAFEEAHRQCVDHAQRADEDGNRDHAAKHGKELVGRLSRLVAEFIAVGDVEVMSLAHAFPERSLDDEPIGNVLVRESFGDHGQPLKLALAQGHSELRKGPRVLPLAQATKTLDFLHVDVVFNLVYTTIAQKVWLEKQ